MWNRVKMLYIVFGIFEMALGSKRKARLRPHQINFMDDGFAPSILPWLEFVIKKN